MQLQSDKALIGINIDLLSVQVIMLYFDWARHMP